MKLDEYDLMYRVEDTLWWYRGMWAITRAVIERFYARGSRLRILDAGCGTGASMTALADYGCVTGVDLSSYALHLSRRRDHARLACGSVLCLPFRSAAFDLITSFDVLQMLPHKTDRAALSEMARLLASGGRLIVRVAAYDWLRGAHDRLWEVTHRYVRRELRAKLERAGLVVEHASYLNMWLFPAAALKRLSEPLLPAPQHSDLAIGAGPFNDLLTVILASEAALVVRGSLPFGLSLLMVGRKS